MFFLRRPRTRHIQSFLQKAATLDFSYSEQKATLGKIPSSFVLDRYSVLIGEGEEAFLAGKQAILNWSMYPKPWTRIHCEGEIAEGTDFVAEISHFGFHSLNACRILYVLEEKGDDERGDVERFGFGFGTLSDHAECGEEVFSIEWHRPSNEVYYRILAMSRPQSWLVKLMYPLARMLQKRFAKESQQSIKDEVLGHSGGFERG